MDKNILHLKRIYTILGKRWWFIPLATNRFINFNTLRP